MAITSEEQDEKILVSVEGAFTIYEAPELREALLRAFENHAEVLLDLSGVTECDTAGIQLLCSARTTADTEGKRFMMPPGKGPAEPVTSALMTAGLAPDKVFHQREEV